MSSFFCRKAYFPSQTMLMAISFLVVYIKVMIPEFSDFPQALIISCNNLFHNACLKLLIHSFIQQIFTSSYQVFDIVLGTGDIVENKTSKKPHLMGPAFYQETLKNHINDHLTNTPKEKYSILRVYNRVVGGIDQVRLLQENYIYGKIRRMSELAP